jgi:hypothetical protein
MFNTFGRFQDFGRFGGPGKRGSGGSAQGALTVGATTLLDTMIPGDVVATISGKVSGTTITLSGAATGILDVSDDGTQLIVGPSGPGLVDSTTGTYSLDWVNGGSSGSSGPFSSITVGARFRAVDNNGNSSLRSAVAAGGDVGFGMTSTTYTRLLLAFYFRPEETGVTKTLFNLGNGYNSLRSLRIRQSSTGRVFAECVTTGLTTDLVTNVSVGQWYLCIAQVDITTATPANGRRAWANGVRVVNANVATQASMLCAGNTTVEICGASASPVYFDMRLGYIWTCFGTASDFGLFDFDDPAKRAVFDINNLDPNAGVITLVDVGSVSRTLTPQFFYHVGSAQLNSTLPNRGSATGTPTDLTKQGTAFTFSDFTSFVQPALPSPTPVAATEWSNRSITFQANMSLNSGQFVLGEYWVDNSVGGQITKALPDSSNALRTASDLSTTTTRHHGAMINWGNTADTTAYPGTGTQAGSVQAIKGDGFNAPTPSGLTPGRDGSMQGMDAFVGLSTHLEYEDALNKDPSYAGAVSGTNKSLTKFASRTGGFNPEGKGMANDIATLTLLNGTPPNTTDLWFRPGMASTVKDFWVKAGDADIDMTPFPAIAATGLTNVPSFEQLYEQIRYPSSMGFLNHGTSRNVHARNYAPKYGDEWGQFINQVVVMLCLDSSKISVAQKRWLVRGIIQLAIDIAVLLEEGRVSSADGLGCTSMGRKILLGIAIVATASTQPTISARFAAANALKRLPDDRQIGQIVTGMTTRPIAPYPSATGPLLGVGDGEWSGDFFGSVRSPPIGGYYPIPEWTGTGGVQYRHQWAYPMFGQYCGIRCITGLETAIDWPDFVSYMRKYYAYEQPLNFPGYGGNNLKKGPSELFVMSFRQSAAASSFFP